MKVAIILGNRINNDGSLTSKMIKRLELAYELYQKKVDKIIVSGGQANQAVPYTEAEKMAQYLIEKGVPKEMIILEDKSHTTSENAKFSVPIAKNLGADEIIVTSTIEHFANQPYNVIKMFAREIFPDKIKLLIYTDVDGYDE